MALKFDVCVSTNIYSTWTSESQNRFHRWVDENWGIDIIEEGCIMELWFELDFAGKPTIDLANIVRAVV